MWIPFRPWPSERYILDLEHRVVHDGQAVRPECRIEAVIEGRQAGCCVPDRLEEALLHGFVPCRWCLA